MSNSQFFRAVALVFCALTTGAVVFELWVIAAGGAIQTLYLYGQSLLAQHHEYLDSKAGEK